MAEYAAFGNWWQDRAPELIRDVIDQYRECPHCGSDKLEIATAPDDEGMSEYRCAECGEYSVH